MATCNKFLNRIKYFSDCPTLKKISVCNRRQTIFFLGLKMMNLTTCISIIAWSGMCDKCEKPSWPCGLLMNAVNATHIADIYTILFRSVHCNWKEKEKQWRSQHTEKNSGTPGVRKTCCWNDLTYIFVVGDNVCASIKFWWRGNQLLLFWSVQKIDQIKYMGRLSPSARPVAWMEHFRSK